MKRMLAVELTSLALTFLSPPNWGERVLFEVERRKDDIVLSVKTTIDSVLKLEWAEHELVKSEWKEIFIPYWKIPPDGMVFEIREEGNGGGSMTYLLNPLKKIDPKEEIVYHPILMTGSGKVLINETFSYSFKESFCWDYPDWIFSFKHQVGHDQSQVFTEPKMLLGASEKGIIENGEFDLSLGGYLLDMVPTAFDGYTLHPKYVFKYPNGVWNSKIIIDGPQMKFETDFIFNPSTLLGEGGKFSLYEG